MPGPYGLLLPALPGCGRRRSIPGPAAARWLPAGDPTTARWPRLARYAQDRSASWTSTASVTGPTIRLATRVEQLSLLRVPGLRPGGALAGEQPWRASG